MEKIIIVAEIRNHKVGIEGDFVAEIIALPLLKNVPSSHPSFCGVLNLRGEIIPVYDLGKLIWNDPIPIDKQTQLIVSILNDHKAGFLVDRVLDAEDLRSGKVEKVDGLYNLLPGVRKIYKKSSDIIPVLDLRELLDVNAVSFEVNTLEELDFPYRGAEIEEDTLRVLRERAERISEKQEYDKKEYSGLLVIRIIDERFAIKIDNIKEITRPEFVTFVPGAPEHFKGIVALRGEIIPIIEASKLLFEKESVESELQRIIFLSLGAETAGFLVDEIESLVFINEEAIEMPISTSGRLADLLVGEVFIENDLVSIIDLKTIKDIELGVVEEGS